MKNSSDFFRFTYVRCFLLIGLLSSGVSHSAAQQKGWDIGVAGDLEKDSVLNAAGYRFLIGSASQLFSPRIIKDEKFIETLTRLKHTHLQLYAVNLFLPGDLKVVGPAVNETAVLEYAEALFKRCQQANVKMVVWGSGGSRQVPDGFDPAKAKIQFISIAKKIAALAKNYHITLAFESLNSSEVNFVNTLAAAVDLAKQVDHPNFKLNVDIYHMLMEGESPAVIRDAAKYIVHCEVAEKKDRAAPGTSGEDFSPYFKELKKANYKGKVFIECRWTNLDQQAGLAYQTLRRQIDSVF